MREGSCPLVEFPEPQTVHCPDYVKLAQSYGAQGIRVQSLDELGSALKDAIKCEVSTVIDNAQKPKGILISFTICLVLTFDIPIDPEEDVLPFVAPGTPLKDMILPS